MRNVPPSKKKKEDKKREKPVQSFKEKIKKLYDAFAQDIAFCRREYQKHATGIHEDLCALS